MNPLHHKLTHDLDKISMMRRIFTQRAATKDGIYLGQLPAMRYIAMNPGCTQKDVAEFIQVSPPSIAVMVKRMVRDGVVQKKADEKDKSFTYKQLKEFNWMLENLREKNVIFK